MGKKSYNGFQYFIRDDLLQDLTGRRSAIIHDGDLRVRSHLFVIADSISLVYLFGIEDGIGFMKREQESAV